MADDQTAKTAAEIGLKLITPITDDEKAELDFLRYETAHLQVHTRTLEAELDAAVLERDTIRHQKNLMAQDFQWTLNRLGSSPLGPVVKRMEGFKRMQKTWGDTKA